MYSVVLMAALATSTATPDFGHGCRGCHGWGGRHGCHGCYGGWGCSGCYGGYGCSGCNGCYGGGWGCYGGCYGGGHGGYGGGWGCYGCWGGQTGWACYGFAYGGWGDGGWGCSGCYGAYGGYSGYGVPVPGPVTTAPGVVAPGRVPEVTPPPLEKRPIPKIDEQVRARVRVDVPADARLYIDGQLMRTAGRGRTFQTPPLAPGKAYFYDVKVEIDRDGRTMADTQRVVVRAGQMVSADFASLEPRGATTTVTAQRNEE
jgi:uncharacterized protein (TIGR03000 family)